MTLKGLPGEGRILGTHAYSIVIVPRQDVTSLVLVRVAGHSTYIRCRLHTLDTLGPSWLIVQSAHHSTPYKLGPFHFPVQDNVPLPNASIDQELLLCLTIVKYSIKASIKALRARPAAARQADNCLALYGIMALRVPRSAVQWSPTHSVPMMSTRGAITALPWITMGRSPYRVCSVHVMLVSWML